MQGLRVRQEIEQYTGLTNHMMVELLGWGKLDRELNPKIQALIPILEAGRDAHVRYHRRILEMSAIDDLDELKAVLGAFNKDPDIVQHHDHYEKRLTLATVTELAGLPDYRGSETLRAQVCDAYIGYLNDALSLGLSGLLEKVGASVKGMLKDIPLLPEELRAKAHVILGTYAAAWCNEILLVPLLRDDPKVTADENKRIWCQCQSYIAGGVSPSQALTLAIMPACLDSVLEYGGRTAGR
jgi:hypothetical protein